MATNADKNARRSFASLDPALRKEAPESLLRVKSIRDSFEDVRDPYIKRQRDAMRKTEAKRREEGTKGSKMVKLHKPFPELKPKHDLSQIRATFNNAWLKEQRKEKLAQFRQQELSQAGQEAAPAKQRVRGYER